MAGSDRKGPEGLRQCYLALLCKVGHNSTATEKCEYLETASQKSVSRGKRCICKVVRVVNASRFVCLRCKIERFVCLRRKIVVR